jgi:hypothetical protein
MKCRYLEGILGRNSAKGWGCFGILAWCFSGVSQSITLSVTPSADAFVRSVAPATNYGAAGAISVSGAAAANGAGEQNGLLDSLLRFPAGNLVAVADAAFGTHEWGVSQGILCLNEVAEPLNPIFNRGIGKLEIRWISFDNWIEGTGTPLLPTTDGVAYNDLLAILGSGSAASLGQFTNSGLNGRICFKLAIHGEFVEDIRSGGEVSLFLTAASPQLGFTANARNFDGPSVWPVMEVTLVPAPTLRIKRLQAAQVSVGFNTRSNWTYLLQTANGLPGTWSNLLVVPSQPTNSQVLYLDGVTNRQRFYRLSVSQ